MEASVVTPPSVPAAGSARAVKDHPPPSPTALRRRETGRPEVAPPRGRPRRAKEPPHAGPRQAAQRGNGSGPPHRPRAPHAPGGPSPLALAAHARGQRVSTYPVAENGQLGPKQPRPGQRGTVHSPLPPSLKRVTVGGLRNRAHRRDSRAPRDNWSTLVDEGENKRRGPPSATSGTGGGGSGRGTRQAETPRRRTPGTAIGTSPGQRPPKRERGKAGPSTPLRPARRSPAAKTHRREGEEAKRSGRKRGQKSRRPTQTGQKRSSPCPRRNRSDHHPRRPRPGASRERRRPTRTLKPAGPISRQRATAAQPSATETVPPAPPSSWNSVSATAAEYHALATSDEEPLPSKRPPGGARQPSTKSGGRDAEPRSVSAGSAPQGS